MIDNCINENLICLNLQSTTKTEVLSELVDILVANGNISNKAQFLADINAREAVANTGFEDGIAFPHAKSNAVITPGVAIGICKRGIEYGADDGGDSKLFFMIASNSNNPNLHLDILAAISNKLIEPDFINKVMAVKNTTDVLNLFLEQKKQVKVTQESSKGFLIGVTGCPTGVAHTYLAAEALEIGAANLGYVIKVETNGSVGVKNSPNDEDIARADAIIVSCDTQVNLDRFAGKRLIKTSVKAPIKHAEKIIQESLDAPIYQAQNSKTNTKEKQQHSGNSLYTYLMNGVSYMIPFVVTGGLLIAIALAIGGQPTPTGMVIPKGSEWQSVLDIGVVSFTLMIPVLAGFIAMAIGDRAALAPGLIGGWIANNGSFYHASAGTGFIGAIIAGLLVGYFVRWIANLNYNKMLRPLVPIFIAPISGTLFIAAIFIFVIGAPISGLMLFLNHTLQDMSTGNAVLLGIVMGGMAGFDMGGPFNKVAFLFSIGMIASGQTQFMGAMACAIPVAPLGMAISTIIGRKMNLFSDIELEAGKAAGAMGLVGISEGAIPFAAQDPLSVIPANVAGSMLAAVMAFSLGITDSVAHGGPIVALLGAMNKPILAITCMLSGAILTAIVAIVLKKYFTKKTN